MPKMQYVRRKQEVKNTFIDHFEKSLGEIEKGWRISTLSRDIQVVKSHPEYFDGVVAYSTLGLSSRPYRLKNSEKNIRCELFLLIPQEYKFSHIPSIFEDVVNIMDSEGNAFSRGDIIGPKGELFKGYRFTSLYVAPSFVLPDFSNEFLIEGNEVIFIWLVPITTSECEFVKNQGWEMFENRLEEDDVDAVDIERSAVV